MGPLKATRVTFAKRMKIRALKVSVVGGCAYFDGFGTQHGLVEQNCYFFLLIMKNMKIMMMMMMTIP